MYGHDPGHSFSQSLACAQINTTNVATLTERWFFNTGDFPISASAAVVNGVAYAGDFGGTMHAIDVNTGTQIWSYAIDSLHTSYPGKIVSSAAVDTMRVGATSIRVLVFGGAGVLYVLDPVSGAVLAKQDLDPRVPQANDGREIDIESSPVIGHFADGSDRIFVGTDVHNDANVGRTGLHSFALVANPSGPTPYSLQLDYKFDPETRIARHSLGDGSGTGRGCGGIWSSPVFDPDAFDGDGLVVFGTANCGNDTTNGEAVSEGVYAINAMTGALQWEHHPRAYNEYDDDFGSSANLLPGGLVGEGSKDGYYYAFDRQTGAPAPGWPLTPAPLYGYQPHAGLAASHPAQSGHLNPGFAFGGILGSPAVGVVNGVPAIFIASALSSTIGEVDPSPMLDPSLADDPNRMQSLHAISAVDGSILWRSPVARPSFGAPTYANGIVFVPSTVGLSLQAYDANTGTLLVDRPVNGAPASSPTIVGNTVFIGTGTTAEGIPATGQQHGLHAFSIPADPVVPGVGLLLSPQANELDAYDLSAAAPTTTRTTPIHAHDHEATPHPVGNDTNGQVCEITQADGSVRYVAGHDNDQEKCGNPGAAPPPYCDPWVDGHPTGQFQGWALYVPTGAAAGEWTFTDKLIPAYNFTDPPNDHLPDNTGCAFSKGSNTADPADDMLFLVDIGVGAFENNNFGSLYVYYRDAQGNFSHDSPYCVLDNNLTTAGYIAVDDIPDDGTPELGVLVPESGRMSGGVISRFSGPFPSPSSCPDPTQDDPWNKTTFIQDVQSFTPISIARRDTDHDGSRDAGDTWVVGNTVPALVNEYDTQGNFIRPLAGDQPTPGVAGVAVDANQNVYWANLGLAPCDTILCPVDGLGTVWKLSFDPVTDAPLTPVLLQNNLTYPDGVGIANPLPEPSALAGLAAGALLLAACHRARRVR
jgi:outer membrane protein assembly factor BamB